MRKRRVKDDGERLTLCDDLTCGFTPTLLSAFIGYRHFYCGRITNEQVQTITKRSQCDFIHTSFTLFHCCIEADVR